MLLSSPPSAACRCCRHPCFPRYAVRYICVVPLVSYPGVPSCPIEASQVFWFLFSSGPSSSSPLSPSRPFFSTVLLVHLCIYRGVYGGHDMRARERLASFGFGGFEGGGGGGRSGRSGPVLTTGLHRFVPEQRCGSSSSFHTGGDGDLFSWDYGEGPGSNGPGGGVVSGIFLSSDTHGQPYLGRWGEEEGHSKVRKCTLDVEKGQS